MDYVRNGSINRKEKVTGVKDTKFVKARCQKTNEAFGIEVKKFGSKWKAVDFVKLTREQDAKLESQVDVDRLEAADSIQACSGCGSRKIGGCGCAARDSQSCRAGAPYAYQCIFCNKLTLDFSDAAEAREGEQITLSQGQVITLTKRGVEISRLMVGMGWNPSETSHNMDLDSSVVMIKGNAEILETVYFGNLSDKSGGIKHYGDNLVGSEKYGNDREKDDENISIDLSRVPQSVKCLAFIVNIYDCVSRRQTLADARNLHIRLIEDSSKKVLAKYSTLAQNQSATGLIIGAAYRTHGKWSFKAMGDCFVVDGWRELAAISKDRCRDLLSK